MSDQSIPETAPNDRPIYLDEDDRYARQRLIAWWDQSRLAAAHLMVIGAGALGNEVIKNAVLLGIGRLTIVDFDTIEPSNLARSVLFRGSDRGRGKAEVAAIRARELNPDCQIVALDRNVMTGIGLGLFRDADVVMGCLDNREARLWVNRCCWRVGTPWIDGAIQEINGVVRVFVPPDGPCYECGMTEIDYQLINVRYSCPLLKREDFSAGRAPTTPTIASIVAGWQTQEAVKMIHGLPTAAGQALVYNGLANHFYTTRLTTKPDCLSHETFAEPLEVSLDASATAESLFAEVRRRKEWNGFLSLALDRDLVLGFPCSKCATWREVLRTAQTVDQAEAICPRCREMNQPEMTHVVEADTPLSAKPLSVLGVPARDIVRVRHGADEICVLLQDEA